MIHVRRRGLLQLAMLRPSRETMQETALVCLAQQEQPGMAPSRLLLLAGGRVRAVRPQQAPNHATNEVLVVVVVVVLLLLLEGAGQCHPCHWAGGAESLVTLPRRVTLFLVAPPPLVPAAHL